MSRLPQDSFVPRPNREINGRSRLHKAIRDDQLGLARRLIAEGANLRAQDSAGQTPLHYAAARDEMTLIETLLQAGADPYQRDNMGDTPMHTAALNARSGTTVLLARTLAEAPERLALWPNHQQVDRLLEAFRPAAAGTPYADIDRLVENLSGTNRDLNSYNDVFKYEGHLLDLDDKVFGIRAEGWNHVAFLYQRLRSCVSMWTEPGILPPEVAEHFDPQQLRDLLKQEIMGLLASLNTVRHFYTVGDINEEAQRAVRSSEVAQITRRMLSLSPAEEFTIPLGLPTHAIYCSLRPAKVDAVDVIVLRIDNRGWGWKRGHDEQDKTGKLAPFSLNIPRAWAESRDGSARLHTALKQLVAYMHDSKADIGLIYAQLVILERHLHRRYSRALIAPHGEASEQYWKNPQSVGNCSLKNHNAAMWSHMAVAARARLGSTASSDQVQTTANALWKWFHTQEVELILDRMWNAVVTPKSVLNLEQEKRARELKDMLQDSEARRNRLADFLAEPRRERLAKHVPADILASLIRASDLKSMRQLVQHGVDLHDDTQRCIDGGSLLHVAVRTGGADATAMVALLVEAGAPVDESDAKGRTPSALAVHLGKAEVLMALLQRGSAPPSGSAEVEAVLRQQLANTQRALLELQQRRAASTMAAAVSNVSALAPLMPSETYAA